MMPSSVLERFEEIDVIAARARSIVSMLILHYTTTDRHSELGDTQMVDVLEIIEESLERVCERAQR